MSAKDYSPPAVACRPCLKAAVDVQKFATLFAPLTTAHLAFGAESSCPLLFGEDSVEIEQIQGPTDPCVKVPCAKWARRTLQMADHILRRPPPWPAGPAATLRVEIWGSRGW